MKSGNLLHLPKILALFLFVLLASSLQAQDIIVMKKTGETLKVKITEVGLDEIKYKPWPVHETDPVIVLDKRKVRQVTLESGTVLNFFVEDMDDPKNYIGQRRDLIKIDFMSTVIGTTSLAYEHSLKPGRSAELGLGLIGLGFNTPTSNVKGAFLRAGYKFINTPDFTNRGTRYSHILKGAYIRPELVFVNYNHSESYVTSGTTSATNTYRTTGGAFVLNFGKQFVFDNIFAVDVFGGLGVGGKNTIQTGGAPTNNYWAEYGLSTYGFLSGTGGDITPVLQFGLKVGLLIGSDKETAKP